MNKQTNEDVECKLKEYSESIGRYFVMTLDELIDSHRSLRDFRKQKHSEWLEELNLARERGFNEGKKKALEEDYISREALKSMKLSDLMELLND